MTVKEAVQGKVPLGKDALTCNDCSLFVPLKAYDGLLGWCNHPLVLKLIGKTLVNNTSQQSTCGKRGVVKL